MIITPYYRTLQVVKIHANFVEWSCFATVAQQCCSQSWLCACDTVAVKGVLACEHVFLHGHGQTTLFAACRNGCVLPAVLHLPYNSNI